jgi:hypothetical protein
MRSSRFFTNRKVRREKVLRKMEAMRAAKARKRLATQPDPEPKMERWCPLQIGVRDRVSGDVAWTEFRSIRDAVRRLTVVRRFYKAGKLRK